MRIISVVMTTKNSGSTIRNTFASLAPYQEKGYIAEIVVIDAGSTDDTIKISESYGAKVFLEGPTIPILKSRRLFRSYASFFHACNLGWKATKGDLVMFIDSDAYVGSGFCPTANLYFEDPNLGTLGCQATAVYTNPLSKTIAEMWDFHSSYLKSSNIKTGFAAKSFSRVYELFVWGRPKMKNLYSSGPCYIATRASLESVGGLDLTGDIGVSEKIVAAGWESKWWVDAPLFHKARDRYSKLARERLVWGFMTPYFFENRIAAFVRTVAAVILAPIGGLMLSRRSFNFRHVPVQCVIHLSVLVGVIWGLFSSFSIGEEGLRQIEDWVSLKDSLLGGK